MIILRSEVTTVYPEEAEFSVEMRTTVGNLEELLPFIRQFLLACGYEFEGELLIEPWGEKEGDA